MNYIDSDDLNNAKKKILFLLSTKYKDPNSEYIVEDDTDTDASFMNIVGGIEKSRNLLLQLLTFITREYQNVKRDVQEGMKQEQDGVRQEQQGVKQVKRGTKLVQVQVEDVTMNGRPRQKRDGTPIYKKVDRLVDNMVEEPNMVNVPNIIDVPNMVEKEFNEPTGRPYFRSTNTYISFNQLSINLESNLKTINVVFSKLVNNIGYVEPENMQLYKENLVDFMDSYEQLDNLVVKKNDEFAIVLKAKKGEEEALNIKTMYIRIGQEVVKLLKYNTEVISSYNYKNSNMQSKRSPQAIGESTPSINNAEDDE